MFNLLRVGVDPLERDEARSLPVMGVTPGLLVGADVGVRVDVDVDVDVDAAVDADADAEGGVTGGGEAVLLVTGTAATPFELDAVS